MKVARAIHQVRKWVDLGNNHNMLFLIINNMTELKKKGIIQIQT
jgi:hypothetical protein